MDRLKIVAYAVLIAVVGLVAGSRTLTSQFHGEDEMMFLNNTQKLVHFIKTGDINELRRGIIEATNPPASSVIPLPFVLALGKNEVSIRLPHWLIWAAAGVVAYYIGNTIGGLTVGIISGLLVSLSGLQSLMVTANGHGYFTFWILLFIALHVQSGLPDCSNAEGRWMFIKGHFCLGMAFLAFNTDILMAVPYSCLVLYPLLKKGLSWNSLRWWFGANVFVALFYLIYYALFIGLPWWLWSTGYYAHPMGFHARYIGRIHGCHWNTAALWENMCGINGYFFPYLSWLICLLGIGYCMKQYRWLIAVFAAYVVFVSFYMSSITMSHFLPFFVSMLPFGVAGMFKLIRDPQWASVAGILMVSVVAVWMWYFHFEQYTDSKYPEQRLQQWNSAIFTHSNVVRPLPQMAREIRQRLKTDKMVFSMTDGAIAYYLNDSRMSETPPLQQNDLGQYEFRRSDDKNRFGCVVATRDISFVPALLQETIRFANSDMVLYILKN